MNTLLKGILVGGLAGLLFGFDTAVIAGTTQGLSAAFDLAPAALGMTVSSALWGTLLGALFAGRPGDRFGARDCLRAIALLYVVSALGCWLAPNLAVLVGARVLGGIAIGASSVLAPIYLAEIAPANRRGMMVGAFQFNIVLGILLAYLSNYLVGMLALGADEWRWKFGVAALPSLLLFALVFIIPNSPRWLALKGRRAEAAAVLRQIGVADVEEELRQYAQGQRGGGARLSWARHRKPMLLAVTIAAFNQLSGINAILYYSNDIFAAAGFGKMSADLQSVMIGATNLVFTLLALTVIDRVGRRTLLLIGSIGMVAALSATAAIQLSGSGRDLLLWALILFIASFAFSQGAVVWVYISEIFPTEVRARGQSLGASTHWLMDAIIAGVFPLMAAGSSGLPFVFFAVAMVLQFVVVARYFTETRGVKLEDMAGVMANAPAKVA
ncbi:sugar porter family MFS transporter [Pseudoduganella albidiflava]|uniref:MFS transporter n=1 Tax=Pseudoduganella albidiflava TaxID=321983 RepID=A0A411WW99_9BURK|nr:sugar porter family MFS transporter [Pseudoduganella albidiflava]QBI00767.1 MFS transporter [Pseudoduganella albidiflava]GGY30873.1 MFS transporter [Pseudoduganella albidiflava]